MVTNGKEFQKRGDICTHIDGSLSLLWVVFSASISLLPPTELLNNITAYT